MLISKNQEIVDATVEAVSELQPDFVVHCGDFTSDSSPESFEFGRKNLDRLPCPYYVALGNHDTFKPGSRKIAGEMLESDGGSFSYKRTFNGINLILLDCAHWINSGGEDSEHMEQDAGFNKIGPPDHVLAWLEATCADDSKSPAILAMHAPVVAKPRYPVGSFPGGGADGNDEPPDRQILEDGASLQHLVDEVPNHGRLIRIIERNPQIKLILSGHWHIHDIITRESQVFCSTGSMIEYPVEMRLVELSDRRVSISTVSIGEGRFAEESLIQKYRNEFTAGADKDRTFLFEW